MDRTKASRRIMIAVVVGSLLALMGLLSWIGPLRWVFDHGVLPITSSASHLGGSVHDAITNIGRIKDLASSNQQLQRENADLRQRVAADAETRRDNQILRSQLGLEVAGAPRQVAAEVVAFQPDSYRQFVTINKGSKDGLKNGLAAVSEGVMIGTLSDVSSSTSKIMLVTDPEFKLAVKDQESNADGILQGQLGNGLVMDKIGQDSSIKPGDSITSSGLGGQVPAGLLIGRVQSVNTHNNVIFQSAQISSSLRVKVLRFVFVVVGT